MWFRHCGNQKCTAEKKNYLYFAERMPTKEHWRLFPALKDRTAYLDIETTGFAYPCHITTIALYDGAEVRCYVYGQNMNEFLSDLLHYDLIVTFNGKQFDIPFIEREFEVELDAIVLDLRFVMRDLGLRGGLKNCEKALGIKRQGLEDVNGYFAVCLWQKFISQMDSAALETLLAYNSADAVNLERMMVIAYNEKLKDTPFYDAYRMEEPVSPEIPYSPHLPVIRSIKEKPGCKAY